jgi:hypothetical protein
LKEEIGPAQSENKLLLVGFIVEFVAGHHNDKQNQADIVKTRYPGCEIPDVWKLVQGKDRQKGDIHINSWDEKNSHDKQYQMQTD